MFWGLTYKLSEDLGYKKGDSYIMMLLFGIIMAAALSSPILPFKSWILQINGIWTSMSGASAFTYGQHLTLVIPIALCTIIGYVFLMRFVFKADVKPLANINAEMFNQKPLPKMDYPEILAVVYPNYYFGFVCPQRFTKNMEDH